MASVRAEVGPPPMLIITWQTITATTGSGRLIVISNSGRNAVPVEALREEGA